MGASRVFTDGMLSGQVALITGGGTNLGKAAAGELVRCGASVVVAGRRAEVLEAAVAELGERCSWIAGDIREPTEAHRMVASVLARHDRLDFLLNNAGGQYFVAAEGITAKGWRAVHRLNVSGTLAMCEAARGLAMRRAGHGTIVNVTVSPHHGMPAMAHTGAARAAIEALTRELASSWSDEGVSVVAVAIGRFATESLRKYPAELWRRAAE
ncbi:MAG: SDR family NAD(P)-dependent oxidoreductase, partial [Solirubrobacteraceae bacterium]